MALICIGDWTSPGCGKVLTEEERHYYETVCEKCVSEGMDRVKAWREGGEDTELDALFEGSAASKPH